MRNVKCEKNYSQMSTEHVWVYERIRTKSLQTLRGDRDRLDRDRDRESSGADVMSDFSSFHRLRLQ